MKQKRRESVAQTKLFKDAARALGCDDSEEAFDRALSKIGKAAQEPKPSKPKRKPIKLVI